LTTRIATFVFSDLVDSSALLTRLGDDAADPLRRAILAVLQNAVAAHDGEKVKNLGDGIMAAFTSGTEAVSAGIAMQRGIARLAAEQPDLGLGLRVGLSAGEATVEDGDWFGTPVVEAARLCAHAGAGQVLVSGIVHTLVVSRRRHRFRAVGELDLKGLAAPVAAYAVEWETAGEEERPQEQPAPPAGAVPRLAMPLPGRLRGAPPFGFFGRAQEQEALQAAWEETTAGRGRVALVTGEAGMGKTALSVKLARRAHAGGGAVVLYGQCDKDLGLPYQPFVEALRDLVVEPGPKPALQDWARAHGGALLPVLPEVEQSFPDVSPARAGDPETERYQLFKAVTALLGTVSRSQPVLLVLDDLQWAAKPTLMLLEYVVSSIDAMPVMLLGTVRDTDVSRADPLVEVLANLRRHPSASRLSLHGLVDDEVLALVERASGGPLDDQGLSLAQALHRETEGNPFFVGEMLRHLAESGVVVREGSQWVPGAGLEKFGLPASVREVIGQRLGRLGEDASRVLSLAAVIGHDFDLGLLGTVSGMSEERLLDAVEEARAAAVVQEVAGQAGHFTFSHSLFQHVLYDELGALRRVRAHQRVAAALEVLCGEDPGERVAELARHWLAATRPAELLQTIHYARRAGDRALAHLAPEEAVAWYRQALELHDSQPALGEEGRAELLIALGEAQRRAGQPGFRETLLEAAAAARRGGDTDQLVRAALANNRGLHSASGISDADRVAVLQDAADALGDRDSPERARVLALLAAELTYSGQWERRRDLAAEALAVARRVGDDATVARVLNVRFSALQVPECTGELMRDTAECLEITAGLGDRLERFWALQYRVWALGTAGHTEEVEERLAELDSWAEALGQPGLGWYPRFHRSWYELLAGRLAESEELALEALQIGNDSGQPDAIAVFVAQLAMIRRDQGRLEELVDPVAQQVAENPGIPGFRALLALCYCELDRFDDARNVFAVDAAAGFAGMPYDLVWSSAMTMLAEVCAWVDDRESAAILIEKLSPFAGILAHNGVTSFGAIDRYLGMLATTLGRFAQAEQHFWAAAAIHTRINAPAWLARTHVDWARMRQRRGGPDDDVRARELLTTAFLTARELGLEQIERRTATLLD
jgi:class 3 adenylate cyclase